MEFLNFQVMLYRIKNKPSILFTLCHDLLQEWQINTNIQTLINWYRPSDAMCWEGFSGSVWVQKRIGSGQIADDLSARYRTQWHSYHILANPCQYAFFPTVQPYYNYYKWLHLYNVLFLMMLWQFKEFKSHIFCQVNILFSERV